MDQGEYNFRDIEKRWREHWVVQKTFRTPGPGDEGFDSEKPKYYVLDMFPYTSGDGLHIGHPKGYIATDIYARFKKSNGFNVLHPMGFDSFGLPAEQYAVTHNIHPQIYTEDNIKVITKQFQYLGMGYDWDRELATSSANVDTRRRLMLSWGTVPVLCEEVDVSEFASNARRIARELGLAEDGDYILQVTGFSTDAGTSEPSVTVLRV